MDVGLLPVKRLDAAKSRLAEVFDPRQRAELAAAMLEDALDLCAAADFVRWFALSGDGAVAETVGARGIETLPDPMEGDLNASLAHAITDLERRGASSVTVIPVDAPLATADELHDIIDSGSLSDLVVVPAERDAGTNGLYLSPPGVVPPRFGEGSFSAFVAEAEAAKLRCSILALPGLAVDVDVVADIHTVLERAERETRSIRLLRAWTEWS